MDKQLTRPTVAQYLADRIKESGKPEHEIAAAIGCENAKIILAYTQGAAKVPISKIGPLARALGIDHVYFLRLVMHEYMPGMLEAIDEVLQNPILTASERGLVDHYRQISNGVDAVAVGFTLIPPSA